MSRGLELAALARTSAEVAAARGRNEKQDLLATCLLAAPPPERGLCARYLAGSVPQERLGVGFAGLRALRETPPAAAPDLTLADVDRALGELASVAGAGAARRREEILGRLFAAATREEQHFLRRLLLGELRQGALESAVLDALARAAGASPAAVRRAQMLTGDLAQVARIAFEEGEAGLAALGLELFRPVLPMLAEPAGDVDAALGRLGRAAFETKIDGARVQVHKQGEEVRAYTRTLNDVTDSLPELVTLARALPARALILDGEVIAWGAKGAPLPFQETMRRFGRRQDVEAHRSELPLATFFFDCLYLDGRTLLGEPTGERVGALESLVPASARVSRLVTGDAAEARAFYQRALAEGHEGVMAKSCEAPYEAGSRGSQWLKIKRAHTLDLVVLAAEWGSGRRTGFLSNLHLGARDPRSGGFVMLGKTFKGLTDAMLRTQTAELLTRETHRDAFTVYVRPELVVEVAFSDVQRSPRYPGGMALRLARVKRYRNDKTAFEADTIDRVRALFAGERG